MDRLFTYRKTILGALVVVLTVVLIGVTSRDRDRVTPLEDLLTNMLAPIQGAVSTVRKAVASVAVWFTEVRTLKASNAEMAKRLGELESLRAQLAEAVSENRRLKQMLGFAREVETRSVAVRVIGRNPDTWFSTLVIDRGRADGVEKDDPVVSSGGLVGRVYKVTDRTATVLLLTDPDSSVGGMVQRSRDAGIVLGGRSDGLLKMTLFSRDADIQENDVVITSGLGAVYPKGYLIGWVTRVEREEYGLVKSAVIDPATDFARLEEVLVLKPEGRGSQ